LGSRFQIGNSKPATIWIVLSERSGISASSANQAAEKRLAVGLEPVAFRHHLERNAVLLHRADQPNALLNLAVIQHEARRRDLHSSPVGALVDEQDRTMIPESGQRVLKADGAIALALSYRQEPGLSARRRMNVIARRSVTVKLSARSVSSPAS
jgi:hypothetical protein